MISTGKTTLVPAGTWSVDPIHSTVGFSVKHLGIATVRGKFEDFEGTLEIGEGDESACAFGTVQGVSINTGDAGRDEHLRSADFFDVENNPKLSFQSKSIEQVDEDTYRITGDLTIRGTTREVVFEGVTQGVDQDPWGNTRLGLEVVGQIERSDFGLNWNQALESGGVLVGKKVKILLDLSTVKA